MVARRWWSRGGIHWGWIVAIGCFTLFLAAVALFALALLPAIKGFQAEIKSAQPMERWIAQLREVGRALEAYKADHAGGFPASLEALHPDYLPDVGVLQFARSDPGQGPQELVYLPPPEGAPDDYVVVSLEAPMPFGKASGARMRLGIQKDGELVSIVTSALRHNARGVQATVEPDQ
jgi:hypothetical protein